MIVTRRVKVITYATTAIGGITLLWLSAGPVAVAGVFLLLYSHNAERHWPDDVRDDVMHMLRKAGK